LPKKCCRFGSESNRTPTVILPHGDHCVHIFLSREEIAYVEIETTCQSIEGLKGNALAARLDVGNSGAEDSARVCQLRLGHAPLLTALLHAQAYLPVERAIIDLHVYSYHEYFSLCMLMTQCFVD
jgi:hypothetical protein